MKFLSYLQRKKQKMEPPTPQEKVLQLQTQYDELYRCLHDEYAQKKEALEESYRKKVAQINDKEKHIPFHQTIIDAQNGAILLVYDIINANNYAKTYLFSRGKYTLNRFSFTVNVQKNCMFLSVLEEGKKEPFIRLYYDKVTKNASEYDWDYACDFVVKQQVKRFLCDMMEYILKDRLVFHPSLVSELRTKENFLTQLEENEAQLFTEFRAQKTSLEHDLAQKIQALKASFASSYQPLTTLIAEEEAKKQSMVPVKKEFHVHDSDISIQLNALFHRVYSLMSMDNLLDPVTKHEVHTLYERDIHELWHTFLQLDQQKQQQEKPRILAILTSIDAVLDGFEEKTKAIQSLDYEKKIRYLEKKYKAKS